MYVRVNCFVVRGYAVLRMYTNVCNSDVCINGRRYVCYTECHIVSNECDTPTACLVQPIGAHGGEVMYFGSFRFRGELGFLNCDDICMCVNKQVTSSSLFLIPVYVDLNYNEFYLTFTTGCVCSCVVCIM